MAIHPGYTPNQGEKNLEQKLKEKKAEMGFAEKNEAAQAIALEKENLTAAGSELDDVPEEVRNQLVGADDMIAEERLLKVLANCQPFTLDKIILALWHGFKHTEPRGKVQTRLNKLVKRGVVAKHPTQRSVYQLQGSPAQHLGAGPIPQQGPLSKEYIAALSQVG
jgi:hypothetical protein